MQLFKKHFLMLVMLVMVAQAQQNISELQDAARKGDAAALAKLTALAENDNVVAQFKLGQFFTPEDREQAVFWYRKSAEQGYPMAQISLAYMYESGEAGVPEDLVLSYMWRKLAYIPGAEDEENRKIRQKIILMIQFMTPAQIAEAKEMSREWKPNKSASKRFQYSYIGSYGLSLAKSPIVDMSNAAGGGDTAALAKLEALSNKGDKLAQTRLGSLYYGGNGVPKDPGRAVSLYRKSAEQGFFEAQNMLGLMYYQGYGVPQDYAQAAFWYRKSAEQGFVVAQDRLGRMYRDGKGVPKDLVISYMWFILAAAQGIDKRGQLYSYSTRSSLDLTMDQVAEAQKLSREWRPKP